MKVVFKFDVGDRVIADEVSVLAAPGNRTRSIEVELADLSLVGREALVADQEALGKSFLESGRPKEQIEVVLATYDAKDPGIFAAARPEARKMVLEEGAPSLARLEGLLGQSAYSAATAMGVCKEINARNLVLLQEHEARRTAEAEEKARRKTEAEAAVQVAREGQKEAKTSWIAAHGNDHLRRAHAAGYDCQRMYVAERAAMEFPGFAVDFDNRADWRDRSCPSEDALDICDKVGEEAQARGCEPPEVVWLTLSWEAPAEAGYDEPEDDFEPCEAVVISGFLGKYDLIRIVS